MSVRIYFRRHTWEKHEAVIVKSLTENTGSETQVLELVNLTPLDANLLVLRDTTDERWVIAKIKTSAMCIESGNPGQEAVHVTATLDLDFCRIWLCEIFLFRLSHT